MKKVLFTFALLVSFASFANNPISETNQNKATVYVKLDSKIVLNEKEDGGCWAVCSSTYQNQNTGETVTVTSSAYSPVGCSTAQSACEKKVKKKAKELFNF